jgi:hypothetical protein
MYLSINDHLTILQRGFEHFSKTRNFEVYYEEENVAYGDNLLVSNVDREKTVIKIIEIFEIRKDSNTRVMAIFRNVGKKE